MLILCKMKKKDFLNMLYVREQDTNLHFKNSTIFNSIFLPISKYHYLTRIYFWEICAFFFVVTKLDTNLHFDGCQFNIFLPISGSIVFNANLVLLGAANGSRFLPKWWNLLQFYFVSGKTDGLTRRSRF